MRVPLSSARRPIPVFSVLSCHRLLLLLLLAGLAACGSGRPPMAERGNALLFSPNGEPLSGGPLGHPKCEQAMAGWFARVDADHDGAVSLEEFLADGHAQFARMDIRHAGYVTAADLSEYRAPYENAAAPKDGGAAGPAGEDGPLRGPGGPAGRSGGRNASRGPLVDTRADPVMSADKSLSFKVTESDFIQHGREVFAELNSNHDGRLSLEQLEADCKEGGKDKKR